jgi:hypothetical protein
MQPYSKRSHPGMYEVWASVKKDTDDPNFATFELFLKNAPPKPVPPNGRRVIFTRLDRTQPHSLYNSTWSLYQNLPPQDPDAGDYEGAPDPTPTLTILGRRTGNLWNAICHTSNMAFVVATPKAGEPPSCPCCSPRPQPQRKSQKPLTAAQARRDAKARITYAERTLGLPLAHGLSGSEVLALKAQEKQERHQARIQAQIAALQARLV